MATGLAAFLPACAGAAPPLPPPATAPAPAPLTARTPTPADRCASGDGAACYAAGLALRQHAGTDLAGAEEATRLFARGCEAGVQDACAEQARSFAWGLGTTPDVHRGAALADAACKGKSPIGCAIFGELLREGVGVGKDLKRAESILRAACDSGVSAQSCNETALLLEGKDPAPEAEILAALKRACDGGYAYGCRNLAIRDASLAPGAVLALLERACSGDAPAACSDLGDELRQGKGVPRDLAGAARKYDRACDGGDARGCHWLASFASAGNGVPRDPARAVALYARACDKGAVMACASLATMVDTGNGTDADPAHARELRETACKSHDAAACDALSFVLPARSEEDRADAHRRLGHLCDDDAIAEACVAIGRRASRAPFVPGADAGRALSALRRACTLGSADGCIVADRALAIAKLPVEPKLLERACALDPKEGCARQAEVLRDGGRGRPPDAAGARRPATVSCDAGATHGCSVLADLLDRQGASGADLARAATLRDKACSEGSSASCRALAKMARAGRGVARDAVKAGSLEERADDLDD